MKIISVVLLLAITGCATNHTSTNIVQTEKSSLSVSQKAKWAMMVGSWYGNQPTENGGSRHWIMHRLPQGTYQVYYSVLDSEEQKTDEGGEVGHWGIVGDVYFSIFRGWVKKKWNRTF